MANPASDELVAEIDRFGMIDEAGGHEPLYWGRTNGLAAHGISGEEYVRYSDYCALSERLADLDRALECAEAKLDDEARLRSRLEAAEARADKAEAERDAIDRSRTFHAARATTAEAARDRLAAVVAEARTASLLWWQRSGR